MVKNVSLIKKTPDGAHLAEVTSKLIGYSLAMQNPPLIFTGQARSIQSVRKSLKGSGIAIAKSKVKAYWSPGKTGMD